MILNQYKPGTVAYTSVITAQTTALGNEQAALAILQNRLTASVALIEALGGGWDASQLPGGDGEFEAGHRLGSIKSGAGRTPAPRVD